MKRIYIVLLSIFVTVASGCSNIEDTSVSCLGEQCSSQECVDKQVMSSKDGMLDFCQSPAFGAFAIEKDGITWYFSEAVSYGQFVNGDYWVLDKGEGVEVTKVTPAPFDGYHGSMINPRVGSQAYDKRVASYDAAQLVSFPVTLKSGDSMVSSISVMDSDLNSFGLVSASWYEQTRGMNPAHARVKNASVLTVVSEVPKAGSFRPPYIGEQKKIYNISDINTSILPNYAAPADIPDVEYMQRAFERPWLMHLTSWTNRAMHPVENMPNYYRDIGALLSDASLLLLTDAYTKEILYGFIQTGIDHYYTIINGSADRATFEFQSILTGLLLSDQEIARVWVDDRSLTSGRVTQKFYFLDEGETWTGFKVGFRNYVGQEHEHLHPSLWDTVQTSGGGIKTENYRHCCNSIPQFGMGLASRALNAEKYWPNTAIDMYIDRWVWESNHGYGLDVIHQYYPSFNSSVEGAGTRESLLGTHFLDAMFLKLGFDPNLAKPTDITKYQVDSSDELDASISTDSEVTSSTTDTSSDSSEDSTSSETIISNKIEDTRVITEETRTTETTADPVEETTTTETATDPLEETTTTETATDPVEETTTTETTADPVEETTTTETTADPVEETTTTETAVDPVEETTTSDTSGVSSGGSTSSTSGGSSTTGTSTDSMDDTSTSETSATTVDDSLATEEPVSTEGASTTDTSLNTSGNTESIDLTGGTIDEATMEDVLTTDTTESTSDGAGSEDQADVTTDDTVVEEDSVKTKRSNKIKDERGLPPGRNKK